MTVTYIGDLSTSLDKVRFYINDKSESSGPLPLSANFSDAEINGLITSEGSWQKAVAGALEILASAWATYSDISVGSRKESLSQIAASYQKQAESWRKKHGTTGAVGCRAVTKVDGYSDDISSDDV